MKMHFGAATQRRIIIVAVLLAIYWGVQLGDWLLERYVFSSPRFTAGASRITLRHFEQPDEHPFSLSYWRIFLDRVTRNKPGILAYKAFYVILLAAYAASAIWLFLELTSDRVWRPRPTDTPGAEKRPD